MDLKSMDRKELQALCKKHGIPANTKNSQMIESLSSILQEKVKPKGCLKGSGGSSAEDLGVFRGGSKKVTFVTEDGEEDGDNEFVVNPVGKSKRKSVGRRSGVASELENGSGSESPNIAIEVPQRNTRSRGLAEAVLWSPVIEKKKKKMKKSGDGAEGVRQNAKEKKGLYVAVPMTRSLRNRVVTVGGDEEVVTDQNPRTRKTKDSVKEEENKKVAVLEEDEAVGRRNLRKRYRDAESVEDEPPRRRPARSHVKPEEAEAEAVEEVDVGRPRKRRKGGLEVSVVEKVVDQETERVSKTGGNAKRLRGNASGDANDTEVAATSTRRSTRSSSALFEDGNFAFAVGKSDREGDAVRKGKYQKQAKARSSKGGDLVNLLTDGEVLAEPVKRSTRSSTLLEDGTSLPAAVKSVDGDVAVKRGKSLKQARDSNSSKGGNTTTSLPDREAIAMPIKRSTRSSSLTENRTSIQVVGNSVKEGEVVTKPTRRSTHSSSKLLEDEKSNEAVTSPTRRSTTLSSSKLLEVEMPNNEAVTSPTRRLACSSSKLLENEMPNYEAVNSPTKRSTRSSSKLLEVEMPKNEAVTSHTKRATCSSSEFKEEMPSNEAVPTPTRRLTRISSKQGDSAAPLQYSEAATRAKRLTRSSSLLVADEIPNKEGVTASTGRSTHSSLKMAVNAQLQMDENGTSSAGTSKDLEDVCFGSHIREKQSPSREMENMGRDLLSLNLIEDSSDIQENVSAEPMCSNIDVTVEAEGTLELYGDVISKVLSPVELTSPTAKASSGGTSVGALDDVVGITGMESQNVTPISLPLKSSEELSATFHTEISTLAQLKEPDSAVEVVEREDMVTGYEEAHASSPQFPCKSSAELSLTSDTEASQGIHLEWPNSQTEIHDSTEVALEGNEATDIREPTFVCKSSEILSSSFNSEAAPVTDLKELDSNVEVEGPSEDVSTDSGTTKIVDPKTSNTEVCPNAFCDINAEEFDAKVEVPITSKGGMEGIDDKNTAGSPSSFKSTGVSSPSLLNEVSPDIDLGESVLKVGSHDMSKVASHSTDFLVEASDNHSKTLKSMTADWDALYLSDIQRMFDNETENCTMDQDSTLNAQSAPGECDARKKVESPPGNTDSLSCEVGLEVVKETWVSSTLSDTVNECIGTGEDKNDGEANGDEGRPSSSSANPAFDVCAGDLMKEHGTQSSEDSEEIVDQATALCSYGNAKQSDFTQSLCDEDLAAVDENLRDPFVDKLCEDNNDHFLSSVAFVKPEDNEASQYKIGVVSSEIREENWNVEHGSSMQSLASGSKSVKQLEKEDRLHDADLKSTRFSVSANDNISPISLGYEGSTKQAGNQDFHCAPGDDTVMKKTDSIGRDKFDHGEVGRQQDEAYLLQKTKALSASMPEETLLSHENFDSFAHRENESEDSRHLSDQQEVTVNVTESLDVYSADRSPKSTPEAHDCVKPLNVVAAFLSETADTANEHTDMEFERSHERGAIVAEETENVEFLESNASIEGGDDTVMKKADSIGRDKFDHGEVGRQQDEACLLQETKALSASMPEETLLSLEDFDSFAQRENDSEDSRHISDQQEVTVNVTESLDVDSADWSPKSTSEAHDSVKPLNVVADILSETADTACGHTDMEFERSHERGAVVAEETENIEFLERDATIEGGDDTVMKKADSIGQDKFDPVEVGRQQDEAYLHQETNALSGEHHTDDIASHPLVENSASMPVETLPSLDNFDSSTHRKNDSEDSRHLSDQQEVTVNATESLDVDSADRSPKSTPKAHESVKPLNVVVDIISETPDSASEHTDMEFEQSYERDAVVAEETENIEFLQSNASIEGGGDTVMKKTDSIGRDKFDHVGVGRQQDEAYLLQETKALSGEHHTDDVVSHPLVENSASMPEKTLVSLDNFDLSTHRKNDSEDSRHLLDQQEVTVNATESLDVVSADRSPKSTPKAHDSVKPLNVVADILSETADNASEHTDMEFEQSHEQGAVVAEETENIEFLQSNASIEGGDDIVMKKTDSIGRDKFDHVEVGRQQDEAYLQETKALSGEHHTDGVASHLSVENSVSMAEEILLSLDNFDSSTHRENDSEDSRHLSDQQEVTVNVTESLDVDSADRSPKSAPKAHDSVKPLNVVADILSETADTASEHTDMEFERSHERGAVVEEETENIEFLQSDATIEGGDDIIMKKADSIGRDKFDHVEVGRQQDEANLLQETKALSGEHHTDDIASHLSVENSVSMPEKTLLSLDNFDSSTHRETESNDEKEIGAKRESRLPSNIHEGSIAALGEPNEEERAHVSPIKPESTPEANMIGEHTPPSTSKTTPPDALNCKEAGLCKKSSFVGANSVDIRDEDNDLKGVYITNNDNVEMKESSDLNTVIASKTAEGEHGVDHCINTSFCGMTQDSEDTGISENNEASPAADSSPKFHTQDEESNRYHGKLESFVQASSVEATWAAPGGTPMFVEELFQMDDKVDSSVNDSAPVGQLGHHGENLAHGKCEIFSEKAVAIQKGEMKMIAVSESSVVKIEEAGPYECGMSSEIFSGDSAKHCAGMDSQATHTVEQSESQDGRKIFSQETLEVSKDNMFALLDGGKIEGSAILESKFEENENTPLPRVAKPELIAKNFAELPVANVADHVMWDCKESMEARSAGNELEDSKFSETVTAQHTLVSLDAGVARDSSTAMQGESVVSKNEIMAPEEYFEGLGWSFADTFDVDSSHQDDVQTVDSQLPMESMMGNSADNSSKSGMDVNQEQSNSGELDQIEESKEFVHSTPMQLVRNFKPYPVIDDAIKNKENAVGLKMDSARKHNDKSAISNSSRRPLQSVRKDKDETLP